MGNTSKISIDISELMKIAGIDHQGTIQVTENMSGLESNPKDDWLYLALLSLAYIAKNKGKQVNSIALIGEGNGIDAIATLKLFKQIKSLYITDILPEILPYIQKNIEANLPEIIKGVKVEYLHGRDCHPLSEKVDFIYANLPLVMVNPEELEKSLSTTTLTDAKCYSHLSKGANDELRKYSMLSQLGFLISAKEKLNKGGSIVTLIGGRVPTSIIEETFARAELKHNTLYIAFMKQSDPEFMEQYASFEKLENITFSFYDYEKASAILEEKLGIYTPDVIDGHSEKEIRRILESSEINAQQAYQLYLNNKDVGHLAYAFEASSI